MALSFIIPHMAHLHAPDPSGMRRSYSLGQLLEAELAASWEEQFAAWFTDATERSGHETTAMVVSTIGTDGLPNSRTVLLKGWDTRGFSFYTNRNSTKGQELAAAPVAALLFPWYDLERQVHVRGPVEPLPGADADDYWAKRPRGSQLGAWASPQSALISGREVLERNLAEVTARFEGTSVPRPPHWGGYRVVPHTVEFWQGRPDRLHDRLRFRLTEGGWVTERLGS